MQTYVEFLIGVIFLSQICALCVPQRHKGNPNKTVLEISEGYIEGRRYTTLADKIEAYAFQGIPYAEPPIGELRFQPPYPKRQWKGTLKTVEDKTECVQNNVTGVEDCLYLNVFTPASSSKHPCPVMVYIHGGGFQRGNSSYNVYNGDFLVEQNVVFVSFNYRVGLFGFISTGDSVAPGNNGLRDAILVLRWVQKNIKYFGGNPNSVTLFGESSGSASVSYLLQSKQTKGLFHKAIMQSGTSLCLWSYSRGSKSQLNEIATMLNVPTDNSRILIDGLRKVDYKTLQSVATSIFYKYLHDRGPRSGILFAPVIENDHPDAVLSEKIYEQMAAGRLRKIPSIIGFNSMEAKGEIIKPANLYLSRPDAKPTDLIPIDMNLKQDKREEVGNQIKKYYFGDGLISVQAHSIYKFNADDQFNRPILKTVSFQQTIAPVYLYLFSYEGNFLGPRTDPIKGVAHAEDLDYMFSLKVHSHNQINTTDELVRARVVRMWTNFAKQGNPTPAEDNLLSNVIWPPTGTDFTYLNIGKNLEISRNLLKGEVKFWDGMYRTYGNRPYDTY